MSNLCLFSMRVTGKPEAILEVNDRLTTQDYTKPHFARIAEVYFSNEDTYQTDGYGLFDGGCDWSVLIAMMNEPEISTYSRVKQQNPGCPVVNIVDESKRLDVMIEIYSVESNFAEHFLVDNGDLIVEDSVDYTEVDPSEYDSVDDIYDELGITITQEQFDKQEPVEIGGYPGTPWRTARVRDKKSES